MLRNSLTETSIVFFVPSTTLSQLFCKTLRRVLLLNSLAIAYKSASSSHCSPSRAKPMSRFLLKTLLHGRTSAGLSSVRWFSIDSPEKNPSFTVSYLVNSLGLSPETASSASKKVKFDSPEKPDKIIRFFKNHGFSQTQISSLVRAYPAVLSSSIEKTILPKLDFLKAKGLTEPELAKGLSSLPCVFKASLAKQIIPAYDFFRDLFGSEEKTNIAFRRFPDLLACGLINVVPNICALREHGVSDSKIATVLRNRPRYFRNPSDRFREAIEEAVEMGFEVSKLKFVFAVLALSVSSKPNKRSKIEAYKRWGWTEADFSEAFGKFPQCLLISESNIETSMSFFVKEKGFEPRFMAVNPRFLLMSLKKRVIPRFAVSEVLLSKGLLKEEETKTRLLLMSSEEKFLEKFVNPYEEKAPEILQLYKHNLHLSNAETGIRVPKRMFPRSRRGEPTQVL